MFEERPTTTSERDREREYGAGTGMGWILGLVLAVGVIVAALWLLMGTGPTGGGQGEVPGGSPPIQRPAQPGGGTLPNQPGTAPGGTSGGPANPAIAP